MIALLKDRRGHAAIEYSMIAALIAIGLIVAMQSIGLEVEQMFADLLPAFTATP